MATFAQPTPDENLSPGWTSQGTGSAQSTTGIPGSGYASPAAIPANTVALASASQANAGYPQPQGALNTGSENAGSQAVSILTNPGYADGSTSLSGAPATLPLPTTTGVQQPYGMNATAVITGAAITSVYVSPFQVGGIPAGTSSPWVLAWTGTAGAVPNISVPPAGYLKTVGGNATAVSYTATL